MEDLNGLSWSSDSKNPSKPPPMSSGYLYPTMPSNGGSGRSTPLSATSNRSSSPSKPATSTGDSFANLVSFNSSAGNKNLTLLEQQKRLQEEKARKEAENRSRFEGGQNNQFWDNFEGRTRSPASVPASRSTSTPADDDDILAAFDAAAPVDASTNFPIPESARSSPRVGLNGRSPSNGGITMEDNTGGLDAFDDDDPFGLNQLKQKSTPIPASQPQQGDDDDFLGLLGKPVSDIPHQEPPRTSATPSDRGRDQDASPKPSNDVDRAIAELVDMGFPADKSRRALNTTDSGTDVQAAVGWLLTQAHAESRQKTEGHPSATRSADRAERSDSRNRDRPSWMREEMSESRSRQDRRSPASADKDPAQLASQFGNNLLKSAGSLWKTGSKRFQQAVNEFSVEHDPSQPRWMRDASPQDEPPLQPQRPGRDQFTQAQREQQDFTNEALLLESGAGRPQKPPRPRESHHPDPRSQPPRNQQPPGDVSPRQQANFLQRPSRPSPPDAKLRLSRFAAEEQPAQAYVSPARRKRPQAPPPPSEPAVDLFDSPAPSASRPKPPTPAQTATPPARSASIPVRPKAPTRSIPPVSQEALQSTHRHRGKAAESYKRGDYAEAHQSFSTALSMLPDKHPITIIIRSNRAMTALKIGEPKSAIDDADIILTFIGPSKGESEVIDLGTGEPPKPMKDFFGKALIRKAEALEQLERWGEAAQTWKLAVESGHGGSTSIQGRNRCEKAAGISKPQSKPAAAPARKRPSPPPKKPSASSGLTATSASGTDFEAVSRLRKANEAAERADEEKFALADSVDARIAAWRNGKQDNLRALLGSLDSVLWPEAGWKKIGLSELILPNKVKIQYMKGISKVHPDKISTTATTEQRMIAGSVFGTLNEAWDKFRAENNL
ncbi:Ubiquitin-associated/translation elongation factor EF1B N-terminal eukaryote [Penicillium vulpinum]|uniref:UBA domain-containing protein n=1 Tax=Penicillium vulpinum TaxID=29845 RepID=A0A1V6SGA9_9EURO|nr:Ubiquitin-associated/translation elongation factor EF1B N-terminal eukaryote [Penicillium vulpinum]KAJ5958751.1 Ubiquitin-associated/translation elongation factor EF1B N-terminal eukaryote [Penicillium vulpinum]OQE12603.1 hypothetical protein PENVUL_c001G02456 [Penicillium vulpinum]